MSKYICIGIFPADADLNPTAEPVSTYIDLEAFDDPKGMGRVFFESFWDQAMAALPPPDQLRKKDK
jgi:hypothetical protein